MIYREMDNSNAELQCIHLLFSAQIFLDLFLSNGSLYFTILFCNNDNSI